MKFGLIKISATTPNLRAGDIKANTKAIIEAIADAHARGSQIIVMPELCITGATGGSMLLQRTTASIAESGLLEIASSTKTRDILAIVGLPLRVDDKMFNASAVVAGGKIVAVIPNPMPKNGFSVPSGLSYDSITIGNYAVPFGAGLILRNALDNDLNLAILAGEGIFSDFYAVSEYAKAGVNVILHPTASMRMLGDESRLSMLKSLSESLKCAIVSVSSGKGESTSDGVYSGEKYIIENGQILASGGRETSYVINDVDTEVLYNARMKTPASDPEAHFMFADIKIPQTAMTLDRQFSRFPYVPNEPGQFAKTMDILAEGVYDRMQAIGTDKAVLGVSGGTDSACTALVLSHICKKFALPTENIICVTMPGFASGARTQTNAKKLISALKFTQKHIPISNAVRAHLSEIGCNDSLSLTAENAQARERTQILLDIANSLNALVLGTGDMSEIALGWSTYGGDQLAHYNCNSSLTKTFIKALLRHISFYTENKQLAMILADILDTPVSPELKKNQITEDIIGPYELHDFFIYHMIAGGFSPKKVLYIASSVFPDYSPALIKKTLKTFINRFFTQQFKRNASCDGIRISPFDLSSFKTSSDVSPEVYLAQL